MRKETFTTYAPETDMTFIMIDTYDNVGEVIATECVGWYFGKPDETGTRIFTGKLRAEY